MAHGSGRKKTCFVVMGFGEKTDFQSNPQRVLDLNRSFEDIIAPAVADCGVECIRADTLIHPTLIDKAETDRPAHLFLPGCSARGTPPAGLRISTTHR